MRQDKTRKMDTGGLRLSSRGKTLIGLLLHPKNPSRGTWREFLAQKDPVPRRGDRDLLGAKCLTPLPARRESRAADADVEEAAKTGIFKYRGQPFFYSEACGVWAFCVWMWAGCATAFPISFLCLQHNGRFVLMHVGEARAVAIDFAHALQ